MTPILIEKTSTYEVYISRFEGNPIRFYKDLITQEIKFNCEDIAKTLGYESAHDLLSTDASLDALNAAHEATGVWPITTINDNLNN